MINMLLTTKCVNCLDKQSGFSIAPAAQYCSVARERFNLVTTMLLVSGIEIKAHIITNSPFRYQSHHYAWC